jgi:hypothetical protein
MYSKFVGTYLYTYKPNINIYIGLHVIIQDHPRILIEYPKLFQNKNNYYILNNK